VDKHNATWFSVLVGSIVCLVLRVGQRKRTYAKGDYSAHNTKNWMAQQHSQLVQAESDRNKWQ